MAEEDPSIYRRILSRILIESGFGWVVDHSEAQIAEGKPTSKQVSERGTFSQPEDLTFEIPKPRRRRSSLVTSEPYTDEECLDILLEAIEAAVVQRADLEAAAFEGLANVAAIRSIVFLPETIPVDDGSTVLGKPHVVDRARLNQGVRIRDEAERALSAFRGRSHASS